MYLKSSDSKLLDSSIYGLEASYNMFHKVLNVPVQLICFAICCAHLRRVESSRCSVDRFILISHISTRHSNSQPYFVSWLPTGNSHMSLKTSKIRSKHNHETNKELLYLINQFGNPVREHNGDSCVQISLTSFQVLLLSSSSNAIFYNLYEA